ncbi:hypothetical protein IV102_26505 [bacterium]|nr:hypothetical protein [bacterium]
MNRPLFLLLLLFVSTLALAQAACEFCKGGLEVTTIRYRDGQPHPVCSKCRTTLPACALCDNPSPGKAYRDGRHICPVCRKVGMFDKGRVAALATQVVAFMQQQLGPEAKSLPPIQLVDLDEMQTKFNESGRSVDVVAFYRPYNPEMVYLLSGETEIESGSHLAHELTHAYESRACPQQDRALTEGFACWVQYHYLLSKGATAEAERITRHQDPDYGPSLVKLLKRSQSLGRDKFLQAVKKARKVEDV